MEDIPQPASNPYSPGDTVQVYTGPNDPDSQFHGVRCEVVDVFVDDLASETGRELDAYSYRVRRVDTGDVLPVQFRHWDLIPVE